ncbi:Thylakoid lumenal 29 kDa protein chloroplastic [Zea mays]|nr:Thylakoid lumenal 29 kDa protein chloroplastic [Zea mays]
MAGANFLSTAALVARGVAACSSISTPTRRHPQIRVCCRADVEAMEAYAHEERLRFRRRDFIGTCVGTAIGLEMIDGSTSFSGVATAADLIERRQRSEFQSKIKDTLYVAIKAKPELVPSLLTMALNDAMTYDKTTKTGGANGSIRLAEDNLTSDKFLDLDHPLLQHLILSFLKQSPETSRPENSGLSSALDLLTEAKKEIDSFSKGGPISFADLIQFAAQSALKRSFLDAAIAKCGGNEEKGRTLYSAYGSNGQWGLFDRTFGRADAQEADPEGRVPDWSKASVQEMKDRFVAVGLGPRQLAVMSAFLGPDQAATEGRLIADPDCRPWVEKYQRSRETVSRTDYEVDLITTLTKLSSLGQKINYEAYTYPKQKIDLGKLKL